MMQLTAGSYGLILASIFPDKQMAISLYPVLVIPLAMFGGFFVSLDSIPKWLAEISYISFYKYAY